MNYFESIEIKSFTLNNKLQYINFIQILSSNFNLAVIASRYISLTAISSSTVLSLATLNTFSSLSAFSYSYLALFFINFNLSFSGKEGSLSLDSMNLMF